MLGLGIGEIVLIAALILVVVGPERLPHLMRKAGRMYGQVRRAADDLRRAFVLEADRMDAEERYRDLQERRQDALDARKKAVESTGEGAVPQERGPGAAKPDGAAPDPTAAEQAPMPDSPDSEEPAQQSDTGQAKQRRSLLPPPRAAGRPRTPAAPAASEVRADDEAAADDTAGEAPDEGAAP